LVEENNLPFQISALRKALGPDRDFIKTISGRGYCFIADISTNADLGAVSLAQHRDSPPSTNLPAPMSDFIGRETELAEFRRRLLTIFADGAWTAALGPLSDTALVLATIATVLGLAEADPTAPEGLAAVVARKRLGAGPCAISGSMVRRNF
jgi:non-specific serine/threonine protein kinase